MCPHPATPGGVRGHSLFSVVFSPKPHLDLIIRKHQTNPNIYTQKCQGAERRTQTEETQVQDGGSWSSKGHGWETQLKSGKTGILLSSTVSLLFQFSIIIPWPRKMVILGEIKERGRED